MKILYAVQGTGNGHVTRARDIYPELCKWADTDLLLSGVQSDITLPFPVKHRMHGSSFVFGKTGGIDLRKTLLAQRPVNLLRDIARLPVQEYDLVINDFEPVSAWAARWRRVPCISLSHQWAVSHPQAPRPAVSDRKGIFALRHYAPVTDGYGFHFRPYAAKIFTPVIRREVRTMPVIHGKHITVYLPAYDEEQMLPHFQAFPELEWQVFSKHNKQPVQKGNVRVQPISNSAFLESMASGMGVLCGAGFETPAEALFLGKKLMVIPMSDQYEQQCNAVALERMGVPVLKSLSRKYYDRIAFWAGTPQNVVVNYPDQTAHIVARVLRDWGVNVPQENFAYS